MVGALVVGSGVALAASITCATSPCLGTPNSDNIEGTSNAEEIRALAGDDFVGRSGGNDEIYGDEGNDSADGLQGNDTVYGGPDDDGNGPEFAVINLEGGEDSDTIYGGGGNDFIDAAANDNSAEFTTEPVDRSYGGRGNDAIFAADGNKDIINCGRGKRDVAIFDEGIDTSIKGCEEKISEE